MFYCQRSFANLILELFYDIASSSILIEHERTERVRQTSTLRVASNCARQHGATF